MLYTVKINRTSLRQLSHEVLCFIFDEASEQVRALVDERALSELKEDLDITPASAGCYVNLKGEELFVNARSERVTNAHEVVRTLRLRDVIHALQDNDVARAVLRALKMIY